MVEVFECLNACLLVKAIYAKYPASNLIEVHLPGTDVYTSIMARLALDIKTRSELEMIMIAHGIFYDAENRAIVFLSSGVRDGRYISRDQLPFADDEVKKLVADRAIVRT